MPTSPNLGFTYPTPLDPATADLWGATLNTLFLVLDSEAATKTINQSFADFVLSRVKLKDYGESWQTITSSSGAVTFDMETANHASLTLSENVTSFTFSNWTATGNVAGRLLRVIQDSTARTITWPAAVKWAGGVSPTLSTGSGDVDVFLFQSWDGGTTIYGSIVGQDFS